MFIWRPDGNLNIAIDPTALPEQDGTSSACTRLKNLRVDRKGVISLRDGSSKVNSGPMDQKVNFLFTHNGSRYSFSGEKIYRNESVIADGEGIGTWSALQYNQSNDSTMQVYAMNGTARKRIEGSDVYEWGIEPPSTPTVGVGTGTGLTGSYRVRITYARLVNGTVVSESNPSSASSAQSLSNQQLSVTWAASSDPQVTHVRIYRTNAGGTTYLFDQNVAVANLSEDSSKADTALGSEVLTTHTRPPVGQFVFGPSFNGIVFIIKDNLLYYALASQPEYVPATNYIEVSTIQDPGKCGVIANGQIYFITKYKIYYIQGNSPGSFFPIDMKAKTGAVNSQCAVSVAGHGIFHVGEDGVYLFASGRDTKITESNYEPLFRGETVNGMPGVSSLDNAFLYYYRGYLYFGYTSIGEYPTNLIVTNVETQRSAYYTYGVPISSISEDELNQRLLIVDRNGFVRHIEDRTLSTDSGSAIEWDAKSKDFTLQTRAHFPRWLKYDVDASSANTCTGELYLDDALHQSHTVTTNRSTKRRLIGPGNGNRAAIRLTGTGPISIYAVEGE